MRGIVAITAALVFVGCSIGALEGFSSGAGDADASTDDGATFDGATPNEAGEPADAADAAADVLADANAFSCDGGALVCTTFDQGTVAAGWQGTRLESGGTLGTSNDHRTAPFAMRAQLPAMSTEDNQYAALWATWPGVRALRISFDVKITTPAWSPTDKAFALVHFLYPTTTNESYLFVAPTETTLSIEQNAPASRYQKVKSVPYETWTRITLEVVPTTPAGTLRLLYDGVTVYENASVPFATPAGPETLVDFGLARFTPPSPAIDVLFDNVTIEQIP